MKRDITSVLSTLKSVVIPKARVARARIHQRASRAEESAPLQLRFVEMVGNIKSHAGGGEMRLACFSPRAVTMFVFSSEQDGL